MASAAGETPEDGVDEVDKEAEVAGATKVAEESGLNPRSKS